MTDGNRRLVEQIFRDAPFIRTLGIELTSSGLGWCEARITASSPFHQQHGFVHAGVLMTLADHACGGAAASMMAEDRDVITIENKISFLRPATEPTLFCRATVLRAGKTLVFVEAEVTIDGAKGRVVVAKASSTLAVIPLRS